MNLTLTELIQKKGKQTNGFIDWDERRNKYLAAVDDLYRQIERILADPIKQNLVKSQRRKKELCEDYIGTYSVDDLILIIGDEQVRFSPRGRNIVGSSGRVDVMGERSVGMLIVQADGRWTIVESRQPTLKVAPFDESSLAELLQMVMLD